MTTLHDRLGTRQARQALRHLSGQHDQKAHGRKGGQADLLATNRERLDKVNNSPRAGIDDNPEIRAAAEAKFAEALTKEAEISAVLGDVASSTGGEFQHYGERVKYEASIRDKIYREQVDDPTLSASQAAARITDTNRYTLMWGADENFVPSQLAAESAMNDAGWATISNKNAFAVAGDNYDGLNYKFQKGSDVVEVQFHSPQSAAIKDQSHVLYTRSRSMSPGPERTAIENQINALWNTDRSHVPPGVDALGTPTGGY